MRLQSPPCGAMPPRSPPVLKAPSSGSDVCDPRPRPWRAISLSLVLIGLYPPRSGTPPHAQARAMDRKQRHAAWPHSGWPIGQRPWKRQAFGIRVDRRTCALRRPAATAGVADPVRIGDRGDQGARVGVARRCGTAPRSRAVSTTRPRYMTTTRWHSSLHDVRGRATRTDSSCPGCLAQRRPAGLKDHRLHRHVQRRGRLIQDQQLRGLMHDCPGDAGARPLAAGKLMRQSAPPSPGGRPTISMASTHPLGEHGAWVIRAAQPTKRVRHRIEHRLSDGFRLSVGSWNTTWICARARARARSGAAGSASRSSRPWKQDRHRSLCAIRRASSRTRVDLPQPDLTDQARRFHQARSTGRHRPPREARRDWSANRRDKRLGPATVAIIADAGSARGGRPLSIIRNSGSGASRHTAVTRSQRPANRQDGRLAAQVRQRARELRPVHR